MERGQRLWEEVPLFLVQWQEGRLLVRVMEKVVMPFGSKEEKEQRRWEKKSALMRNEKVNAGKELKIEVR